MPSILSLNAFDGDSDAAFDPVLQCQLRRRASLFGAASVLFYRQPVSLTRGQGCWLYDTDDNAYLDGYNNVAAVGHGHPRVVAAVAEQLGRLNTHSRYLHDSVADYAERLLARFAPPLSVISFTCTGSESNDLALRLAREATGRQGIIVTRGAYHGNTWLTTQVSPSSFKQGAPPPWLRQVPAPAVTDAAAGSLAERFAADVGQAVAALEADGFGCAALLVDSIFSSDGIYCDPAGFLAPAAALVQAGGSLLIADEVQPGFGRTGDGWWGYQRHGVTPDIVTLGKPMGNGYPIGGVVTRPDILDRFCRTVGYFNTFAGTPAAAAAGTAVLAVIEEEGLIDHARSVGLRLRDGLRQLQSRHPLVAAVRGAGLYCGVEIAAAGQDLPAPQLASRIINDLRQRRVLIGAAGRTGSVLKIRPPLCFGNSDADQLIETLDLVLRQAG